jgi:hypothetical protein
MGVLDGITQARRATNSPITNCAIGWAFSHSLDPQQKFIPMNRLPDSSH